MNKSELRAAVVEMRAYAKAFDAMAQQVQVPAFRAFSGLLLDFIGVCERSVVAGIDYTTAGHEGEEPLVVEDYEAQYIAERLRQIFGPALQVRSALYQATGPPTAAPPFIHRAGS